MTFRPLPERFTLGDVTVDTAKGSHPSGATIYRLTRRGKSLVHATDFEHNPQACAALTSFAKGCDVLLYDAQYTAAEYERYRGYGHSTPQEGIKVAESAGVSNLVFVHHAPLRNDAALDALQREFDAGTFAKGGDDIFL